MNSTLFVVLLAGGVWVLAVFCGYLFGLGKPFPKKPAAISIQAEQTKDAQQKISDATREKLKQSMDDMKQRISDGTRKY